MNFKDSYKSVVDEIHGDKALLHSILNGETAKKKPFFRFNPIYSVALAAMLFVTVTSIYFKSGIEDHTQITETSKTNYTAQHDDFTTAPETDIGDADVAEEENDTVQDTNDTAKNQVHSDLKATKTKPTSGTEAVNKTDTPKKETVKSATLQTGVVQSEPTTQSAVHNDKVPLEPDKSQLSADDLNVDSQPAVPEVSPSESTLHTPSVARMTGDSAIAYDEENEAAAFDESECETDSFGRKSSTSFAEKSAGGGGGSTLSGGGSARSGYSLSLSEYWSYLGTDVAAKIKLPSDLTLVCPQNVMLSESNGKTTADVLIVSAASDDGTKGFTLAISKNSDLGTLYPGATLFAHDGVKYAIQTKNINNEEINEIINSLK